MSYTIYNTNSGQIVKSVQSQNPYTKPLGPDFGLIEGYYPGDTYRIKDGVPVAYPPKPQDGQRYYFDWTTDQWVAEVDNSAEAQRSRRDQLLAEVDKVNPIWYASLTAEQQQQLQTYRQALLDITDQVGFPTAIEWPAKPTWL